MTLTKLNYWQYLLSRQTNVTRTHLAEYVQPVSHDGINRDLRGETLTPGLLWEPVKPLLVPDAAGSLSKS